MNVREAIFVWERRSVLRRKNIATETQTLGQMLLPLPQKREDQNYDCTFIFDPDSTYQKIRAANNADEIIELIFLLKLKRTALETRPTAYLIEKVFEGLLNPELPKKYSFSLLGKVQDDSLSKTSTEYVRNYREHIGRMAIQVFFETIFDRDPAALWTYFSRTPHGFAWEHSQYGGLRYDPNPKSLLVFLEYFSRCNSSTKWGYTNKIRNFLKHVLTEQLTPFGVPGSGSEAIQQKVGVNSRNGVIAWTTDTRRTLAGALISNCMYEECVDYDIEEAYPFLVEKFLGGSTERTDGLLDMPHIAGGKIPYQLTFPLVPQNAIKKACADKEWGHMLGVLIRLGLKSHRVKLTMTCDFEEPKQLVHESTAQGMETHLALLWNKPATLSGL